MIVENDLTWNAHVKNLVKKLKSRLPKLQNIGQEGIIFEFDKELFKQSSGNRELINQQIIQKREELENLTTKLRKINELLSISDNDSDEGEEY